jgi:hypothetical protein
MINLMVLRARGARRAAGIHCERQRIMALKRRIPGESGREFVCQNRFSRPRLLPAMPESRVFSPGEPENLAGRIPSRMPYCGGLPPKRTTRRTGSSTARPGAAGALGWEATGGREGRPALAGGLGRGTLCLWARVAPEA